VVAGGIVNLAALAAKASVLVASRPGSVGGNAQSAFVGGGVVNVAAYGQSSTVEIGN
jgi:hypothetical protein